MATPTSRKSSVVDECAAADCALAGADARTLDGRGRVAEPTGRTPEAIVAEQAAIRAGATEESPAMRLVLVAASLLTIFFALRYLIWRTSINNWTLWWLSLPLLAAEIFTAFHILGYQYTVWPRKRADINVTEDASRLPVYVFIPTVDEGDAILEPTILGAISARDRYLQAYPNAKVEIIVCNDGYVAKKPGWEATERLAKKHGLRCITREIGGGAKAGNIEYARAVVDAHGECLIAVLDADQVAEPEFLLRTVPSFGDKSVGWVQTRQYYRNLESRVARWAEHQASLFYDQVSPGKANLNSSYICGTNVVIRSQVLDEIGGFPQDSITEDFAASIRTHQSWRSIYLNEILARGLGPLDLTSYYLQQSRWSRGTLGVMRTDWRRVLTGSGLTFAQRIQYLLSGTHYLCGLRDVIFLSCAVVCLLVCRSPVKPVSIETIALYLLPYIAASQLLILLQVRSFSLMTATLIGYSSFPTLAISFVETLLNRRVRFKVTPKSESNQSDLLAITPHILIGLLCVAAIATPFVRHIGWTQTNIIPMLWVAYALTMLMPTFVLARLIPAKS